MGLEVVVISSNSSKKHIALELGAHHFIDTSAEDVAAALQKLGGAKLILATAPNSGAIASLVGGLGFCGTLLSVAGLHEPVSVNKGHLLMNRAQVKSWYSGGPSDCEDTIAFSKLVNARCEVQRYKLDQIDEAYANMLKGQAKRSVVVF
jgi:propanol-preferring alcohol dehydrogenase